MNTYQRLEKCLLPPPTVIQWKHGEVEVQNYSTVQKVSFIVKNLLKFSAFLLVSPVTICQDLLTKNITVVTSEKINQETVELTWPPHLRGFASSLFQLSGLGTKWSAPNDLKGRCDWDLWMDNPEHVLTEAGFCYENFFVDVLSDPSSYIQMLKDHNVTAHRFSLEWAVIEPEKGVFDLQAVKLYQKFIQELIKAEIRPFVTLNHFVVPQWFYEMGNFQKMENIDLYVDFSLKIFELFPEVQDFWSFNELGIKAFQQLREVYPVDVAKKSSICLKMQAAGTATVNMLIAHCKLHQKIKALYPEKKLGLTHQWLKFDTASGNFLEKLIVYYLEKIAFYPVYNFFKDGKYSFEIPFMANIQFEIPKQEFESNDHFLMRLGVQAYPKPLLKMGTNSGPNFTAAEGSYQNSMFTFGSCCEKTSAIMRFGPRWNAAAIDEILDEAFKISQEIFITEYGSDACIQKGNAKKFVFDDDAQADYLEKLTERIKNYCYQNDKNIQGLFCWSDLRRQMEWENGLSCRLGLVDAFVDKDRKLVNWKKSKASTYLTSVFESKKSREMTA